MMRDKPQIASSSYGNCVRHGLSIMRAALGYAGDLPSLEDGAKETYEVLQILPDWFPNHRVWIACAENVIEVAGGLPEDLLWIDEVAELSFDLEPYIMGFAYYTTDDQRGHFVVGQPVLYEHMHCNFFVMVEKKPLDESRFRIVQE